MRASEPVSRCPLRSLARGLALGIPLMACGAPSRPAPRTQAQPSKASLYGDAALVPTRAGEQARTELALSAELERAIVAMPAVTHAAVSVRTQPQCLGGRSASPADPVAIVSLALSPAADAQLVQAQTRALTATWLGKNAEIQLVVAHAPVEPVREELPLPWIVLSVLGLGASLGVTADRAVARAIASRANAARRRARRPDQG